jgi:hypothetical protein
LISSNFFERHGIAVVLLALAGLHLPAAAQISVSSDGSPSYSIPIAVPPGVAGMAPNLGLLYSASGVNGPVGLGWTVQGISMITRCPGSKLLDGFVRRVDYTVNDKLCLDGQRLIQTDSAGTVVNAANTSPSMSNPFQQNDSAGGSNMVREYRTERDIYARIRAYGAAGGNAANGPAYFKVWTKSGQVYEYGVNGNTSANALINTSLGSTVVAWPVSRISDTSGNYIDFQYEQRNVAWGSGTAAGTPTAGHEWNLSEIRYTGTATQAPVNRIVFSYDDRADTTWPAQDRAEAYHQSGKTVSVRLLKAIRTYVNWPASVATQPPSSLPAGVIPVKAVKLEYTVGASGRSRLSKVTECAGGANEAKCMPATTFDYAPGGGVQFSKSQAFRNGPLGLLQMTGTSGEFGVLTGNFFGSGRTDILRWGTNAANNMLYRSDGDGAFTNIPSTYAGGAFNLVNELLFSTDGCWTSTTADFNGDGLADILRIARRVSNTGTACNAANNMLFVSRGDGSFTPVTVAGIDFTTSISTTRWGDPRKGMDPGSSMRTEGKNYYLLDINGDGLLDVITTRLPGYGYETDPLMDEEMCANTGGCTKVYLGQPAGGFVQLATTNLTNQPVYAKPSTAAWKKPYVADINGDGLSDLMVDNARWVSKGDGNFELDTSAMGAVGCAYPLDFNGDGRSDCVEPNATASYQKLWIADGSYNPKQALTTNLTSYGFELDSSTSNLGIAVADFDGDGRSDILRWHDDPTRNAIILSNGDGNFRFGPLLQTSASDQLQKSDGSASFVLGDFTGRGNVEILRMVSSPTGASEAARNALYVKDVPTPPDQLISVTSPTLVKTTLTWVTLSNPSSGALGARYKSDRGTPNASAYPLVDLTLPMYVVATTASDSGTGAINAAEYSYAGLKSAYDGRGWLGFRETKRQTTAPNGDNLTVFTQNLQTGAFAGMAAWTETRLGALNNANASVISRTTNIYCDTTSATAPASATAAAPCASSSKLQRPYLYQSIEEGSDLNGAVLPKVTTTNTFNSNGDPTRIEVKTTGTAVGNLQQNFVKTTVNEYDADNTVNDAWLLGRLTKATVTSSVPNHIASISTSAGSAPNATAVKGSLTDVPPPVNTGIDPARLIPIIMQILNDD